MPLIVVIRQWEAMKRESVSDDLLSERWTPLMDVGHFLGRTGLHYAAIENNMNGALLLLKHGANIEAQDEHVSSREMKGLRDRCLFRLARNASVQSGLQSLVCHVGSADLPWCEESDRERRWLHTEIDRHETNRRRTISFWTR